VSTIEDVRAFWDKRPCNIRHSRLQLGSYAYFKQVSERRYLVEPHIVAFAEFGRWDQRRVLEVGCGIGTDLGRFAANGAAVIGLELSAESARLARQRLQVEGFDGAVRVHDIERPIAQYPDLGLWWGSAYGGLGPPDLIYAMGVLHHTPHPDRALRNLRAVADRGTELRVMLYHRWSTKALAIWLTTPPWRWAGAVAGRSEAQRDSPITFTYSRRQARRLLESAGWEVTSIRCRHIFPWRVDDYVNYRYVKRFPWNLVPTRPLDRLLGWHLLIVAHPGSL
jgi:SAM-dependent methyltransferase